MRKTVAIILLTFISFCAFAQNGDGFNPFTDEDLSILMQDSTVKEVSTYKPVGMLGIRGSYQLNGLRAQPDIGAKGINTYKNISLVYTYYNSLWNMMPNFGLQVAAKYGEWGFNSKYLESEHVSYAELSMLSHFHFDFSRFRFLIGVGPYAGYRINTLKENDSWDQYDNRFDYGIIGGAGFAVIFGRFELQLEGDYQFSLSSIYHMNKYSDEYWVIATPSNILVNLTLFYHLF
ncbi:MAG: outer membrane beta-barrel protein [Bacteroidales bacterium]|nr:outer membrane beta-barrel protein [Bacteroidales bacterium]